MARLPGASRWLVKSLAQAVLARVWGGEWLNHQLQRVNGTLDSPKYLAKRVGYGVAFWERNADMLQPEGARIMEIGTGWDAIHTILLAALGAREIITFDHIAHVRLRHAQLAAAAWRVRAADLARITGKSHAAIDARLERIERAPDLDSLWKAMNATYVAPGDITATGLASRSLDMVYGYAVLAHLPRPMLGGFCAECARVLVPGGVSVQRIGLEDPFNDWNGGDAVAFLRFSPAKWRFLGENSIVFHNRLRSVEYQRIFESSAGVTVRATETLQPAMLARVKAMHVDPMFRGFTPEQLAVTELDLISRFG